MKKYLIKTRILFLNFLVLFCFDVTGQQSYIAFQNEYFGLSNGIQSFLLIEDPGLDSMSVIKQDTSIVTGIKFYIEPITYSKVNKLISEINSNSSCKQIEADSIIVEFHDRNEGKTGINVICYTKSVDYFTSLRLFTSEIKGLTVLSDYFYNCAISMKDALHLQQINTK
jgi:hypothetical protein